MIIQNIDSLLFPIFLYIYKTSKEHGILFFFITVSSLSFYQFIDKKMYYFQHNDLNEYNYIGDKCRLILLQFFLIDIFNVNNISFFIHHSMVLCGLSWSYYFNRGYNLILYLCLNEISSILSTEGHLCHRETSHLELSLVFFLSPLQLTCIFLK